MQAVPSQERALIAFGATERPRRRLYCLPFAGGGPSTFRLWPKSLPVDVEVIALQHPGRNPGSRQSPPGSIAETVAVVRAGIDELHSREPLPFAIFGHSMGALIAFELAVALEQDGGLAPTMLFVSGRRSPDEPHRGEPIHGLDDGEFLDAMQRSYGGVPDAVRNEPDLLALFLPTLRADIRALETYAPLTDRTVRCPVRVYGGADDRRPAPADLAGWQRVAQHEVSVRIFPGDHFYLTAGREALTEDVAAEWSVALARSERS